MSTTEDERYRRTIEFLHENGVDKYVELPQIAAMGDTSSGKSSLLSQILGTTLACSDKITTLCPIRIRLENGELSTPAKVGITWRTPDVQSDRGVKDVSRENLHEEIRAAQAHILSTVKKAVAPDIIEIQLFDPLWDGLTLIDLPGIVRTVGKDEDASIIEDIRNLMDMFLANERCIILAILPATVDFHNSQIIEDAKKVDPATERTLPVITKPDLIDKGAEGGVLDLLMGTKNDFVLGHHMVKCRGQSALSNGVTIADALKEEEKFFAQKEPWKGVAMREIFGVPQLQAKLSRIQCDMIKSSIPTIGIEISELKTACQANIASLGEILSTSYEQRIFFQSQVAKAKSYLQRVISGVGDENVDTKGYTWRARLQDMYRQFNTDILTCTLNNVSKIVVGLTVSALDTNGKLHSGTVYKVKTEGDITFAIVKPTNLPSTEPFMTEITRPQRLADWEPGYSTSKEGDLCWKDPELPKLYKLKWVPVDQLFASTNWLVDRIRQHHTDVLPCFPNYSIFTSIINERITTDWKPLCQKLKEDVCSMIHELVESCLKESCPEKYGALAVFFRVKFQDIITRASARIGSDTNKFLKKEGTPFTTNHYLTEVITKKRSKKLVDQILKVVNNAKDVTGLSETIKAISESNSRLSIDEHVAEDMVVVLEAYGKVASKRCIDEVPMFIEVALRELISAADSEFNAGEDELALMLTESRSTAMRLKQLNDKLGVLTTAEMAFRKLATGRI